MDRLRRQEGLCELRKTNMNTMVIAASMLLLRLEAKKTWVLPENLRDFQIPLYVMVFEIHGFEPIKFWFNLGPNPNPFLLTYPNKGFGFELPQIQIHGIQTDHQWFSIHIKYLNFNLFYFWTFSRMQPQTIKQAFPLWKNKQST